MEASIAVARDPVTEACKILSGAFPPRSYPGIEEEQVKFLMALDERTRAILTLALVAMKKGETLSWEEGLALLRTALGIGKKRAAMRPSFADAIFASSMRSITSVRSLILGQPALMLRAR